MTCDNCGRPAEELWRIHVEGDPKTMTELVCDECLAR